MSEDTAKRYDEVQRGDMAKALLESPLMKEALDLIEQETLAAWENTGALDKEQREALWAFYLAHKKFRNTLISYIQTGQMALMQLEQKRRFSLFRSN